MEDSRPVERRRRRRTPLMNAMTRLMTRSLVAYVLAVAMLRTWALMNMDVTQLIRRL